MEQKPFPPAAADRRNSLACNRPDGIKSRQRALGVHGIRRGQRASISLEATMAQTACKVLGVAFLIAGLVGFVQPHFLGFHFTTIHNVIHLLTAAVALYLGF